MLSKTSLVVVEPFDAMNDVINVDFGLFDFLLESRPLARAGNKEPCEKHNSGSYYRGPEDFGSQQRLIAEGRQQLKQSEGSADGQAQNAECPAEMPHSLFLRSNQNTHRTGHKPPSLAKSGGRMPSGGPGYDVRHIPC